MTVSLIRGSVGPKVKELQKALTAVGYQVVIDGVYGEPTEEAVRSFQADNNLSADGSYGPDTDEALQAALEAAESGEGEGEKEEGES